MSDECYLTTSGHRSEVYINSTHLMPAVHPFSAEEGFCEEMYRTNGSSNINQIKEEEERFEE